MEVKNIRNFCIIAHIDHGKSTLADRLLELTGTLDKSQMQDQVLDNMDLERERGITIKSHAICMETAFENQKYLLNLIDTPGHVDFSYEVSRVLAACEGALLIVDASQGIQAQTISNLFLAIENNLEIIPIINKIDLPGAEIDRTCQDICELVGCKSDDILRVSAKTGKNIAQVIPAIIDRIPPPSGNAQEPLRMLIFDSFFDSYRGVVALVRVIDGCISKGEMVKCLATGKVFDAEEIGTMRLSREPKLKLGSGEVGYLIGNIKQIKDICVGDTISHQKSSIQPLPGFRKVKPMVFAGLYPINPDNYKELRESLEKLKLNDSSLTFEPETSSALGFGFRAGFLGLLHMEIIQERLTREYNIDIITTVPNVRYQIILKNNSTLYIDNPTKLPPENEVQAVKEPFIKAQIITPTDFVGNIMKLCDEKRGAFQNMEYIDPKKVIMHYHLPLCEVLYDFYDKLKSISKGYASFDYDFHEMRESKLRKLEILINKEIVDAFSVIIHSEKAYQWACGLTGKLKELIPRQLFEVVIQASMSGKIISRTVVKALRKNVTAKCYGGDISRKRKLLEKQKAGKKRMKQVGKIEVPQEAFWAVLKMEI
ncbi:MAG: translation elongation factor 4 [bacterium]